MLLRKRYNNLFGHNAGMMVGGKLSHRPLKAVIRTMFALSMLLIFQPGIHAQPSISIQASATVIETREIEVVTIKDMIVDEAFAENGILNISPVTDLNAGVLLVKGRANAQMRITYTAQSALINNTGQGNLVFDYILSGFPSDNKQASEILDAQNHVPQFNEKGEYYLWVGGRVDLNNARPGNYDGDFTLQIEYI